ncbi:nonstructural protein [Microviridae sp.]|nr:nonstructural protein [Microviridae sp.]
MKKNLYTIYDTKAKTYNNLITHDNDATIKRELSHMINSNDNNQYSAHSSDFALFKIGLYDTENAKITLLDAPTNLCNLNTLKNQE